MRAYVHNWGDHKTVYISDTFGLCKVNVYVETKRTVGELYDLIVYPEERGKGFGDKLLQAAKDVAKENGCDLLVLWPDCEEWVEQWYIRNGFAVDNTTKNYDGEPGWSIYFES